MYDLQLDPHERSPLDLFALTPDQLDAYAALDQAIAVRSACGNGIDDDGDGLIDHPDDPGCDAPSESSERSDVLACDDGLDNDGDGFTDHAPAPGSGDPGCYDPNSPLENPQCQDGMNNDPGQDGLIDFDGGASAGLPPEQQTGPDPQCARAPWRDREAQVQACGIGPELLLLGFALAAAGRPRQPRWFRAPER
jgi:hypothetical protein